MTILEIPLSSDDSDGIELAPDRAQWRAFCEHGNELSGSIRQEIP
jgi:hypothetical protein